MRVVHYAPFAPQRCGLYEAARDMVRADVLAGRRVSFVDVGVTAGGKHEDPQPGARDGRGGWTLTTEPPACAEDADVLVFHTGVPDNWVVGLQAPIVWVVHGRPLACFRPEQTRGFGSYSLYGTVAGWPRSKAMVHFWPEFAPYWEALFPPGKQVALEYPPVDLERFAPDGEKVTIAEEHRGRWNGLICDSWREDTDIFEVFHGAVEASRRLPGLKWHVYAMEGTPEGRLYPGWDHLTNVLRQAGGLGQLSGRVGDMERVYRACDLLLTPHRIVTRCTGEALACGIPVVAARGCKVTPYTMVPEEPHSVASAVEDAVGDLEASREDVRRDCLDVALRFDLERYAVKMTQVYERALGLQTSPTRIAVTA